MKPRIPLLIASSVFIFSALPAQEQLSADSTPPSVAAVLAPALRTPQQLEQLLGPIALYPDALIAIILPATTASSDVVLASRFLAVSVDPNQIELQPWDDSVKSLVHYPELVKWMDDNLAWTKQVGEAFVSQPADVMQAIQRLRAQARAAGTLVDSPQQQVTVLGDDVYIVPTQPDTIYIPRYDPEIVYVYRGYGYNQPFLTFGFGFAAGSWLNFDCDWRQHRVWVVDRRADWRNHRDWRQPLFPGRPGYVSDPNRHPWRPPANLPHPAVVNPRVARPEIARPAPLPGTPARPDGWVRSPNENNRSPDSRTPNPTELAWRHDRDTWANPGPNSSRPLVPTPATAAPPLTINAQPRTSQLPPSATIGSSAPVQRERLDPTTGDRWERPRRELPISGNPTDPSSPAPVVIRERVQPSNGTTTAQPRPEYSRIPPPVQSAPPPVVQAPPPAAARAPVAEAPRAQVQAPASEPRNGLERE